MGGGGGAQVWMRAETFCCRIKKELRQRMEREDDPISLVGGGGALTRGFLKRAIVGMDLFDLAK